MKFEFNSLDELQAFLEFARVLGGAFREAANVPAERQHGETTAPDALAAALDTVTSVAFDIARATGSLPDLLVPPCERSWSDPQDGPAQQPPVQDQDEPPKRKRRTKAEIEADRARIQADVEAKMRAEGQQFVRTGDVQAEAPTDAQAIAATSPLAGANPFDASTSNEPAATAALNEAPAGATGTLAALVEQPAVSQREAAQAAVDGLGADVDPQAFIQLRVAEMGGTFDPREHMKKCVEFIGALGKAKYDEAFTLAGTSRAVASYTPADCAKHIAALEYLQIAG